MLAEVAPLCVDVDGGLPGRRTRLKGEGEGKCGQIGSCGTRATRPQCCGGEELGWWCRRERIVIAAASFGTSDSFVNIRRALLKTLEAPETLSPSSAGTTGGRSSSQRLNARSNSLSQSRSPVAPTTRTWKARLKSRSFRSQPGSAKASAGEHLQCNLLRRTWPLSATLGHSRLEHLWVVVPRECAACPPHVGGRVETSTGSID